MFKNIMETLQLVRRFLILTLLIVPNGILPAVDNLKLACLGDSITYGFGLINRENSYPSLLTKALPASWEVRNFGVNGSCVRSGQTDSYDKTGMLEKISQWDPDIVLFMLGSNDSKPELWVDRETYLHSCSALLERIDEKNRTVILLLPPPAGINFFGIRNEIIQEEIYPALRQLSRERSYLLVDFSEKMKNRPYLFIDNVHPNKSGYSLIVSSISKSLKDYVAE